MTTDFLHGVEVVTIENGTRVTQTVRSGVIGVIGTAPDADETTFPLNTPVLVQSRGGYSTIGASGTLPDALNGIFDQFTPFVVVVRVDAGSDDAATMSNIVGGTDVNGNRLGIQAFRDAQSLCSVSPMLLVAPGYTSQRPTGVTAVALSAAGTGYTSAPAVAFAGGGTDPNKVLPTAHAVLGTGGAAGTVASIVVDTPGANLTGTPTVAFSGGAGTGAAGTATLSAYANPVVTALLALAATLRAHVITSGPNTTDQDAITYRNDFDDRRLFIVDPNVKVWDTTSSTYVSSNPAARVAGLIAQIDNNVGFWKSPSNEVIANIGGTDRQVDFALGDPTTRANLLNSNEVATIIRSTGWLLWGNRTTSSDSQWSFLCVSRTADMVDLSIQAAHMWACDQPINKGYIADVVGSVNAYMRQLQAKGAILGGTCWFDPDLNADADIQDGHVTFSYDFTPTYPAERVTFQSSITDDYISSIYTSTTVVA